MDVDMAMQLSRARRETVTSASSPQQIQDNSRPILSALSPREQHELDVARGERLRDGYDAVDEETLHHNGRSSPIDVSLPHLHQTHDPSLLVSLGIPNSYANGDDNAASTFGLPTYQANVSHSNFDFALMEAFAAEEKLALGLSSPTTKFTTNLFRLHEARMASDPTQVQQSIESSSDILSASLRPARHRKLSQSISNPRGHRKGVGGKMALFEGNPAEPLPRLPARLGAMLNGQGSISLTENATGGSGAGVSRSGTGGPGMGILNTGHDRPYRFSFYSNALSATIHARSLSELPAEGQSFEDLFAGIPSSDQERSNSKFAPSDSPDFILNPQPLRKQPAVRADSANRTPIQDAGAKGGGVKGVSSVSGQGRGQGQNDNSRNGAGYFNNTSRNDLKRNGVTAGDSDSEGITWWLDIQSPTDEEMKMLSKVKSLSLFRSWNADITISFRGLEGFCHPPTYHRRHPDGRDSRKDRTFPQLLSSLLPRLRSGSVQPYAFRAAESVYHRISGGHLIGM
jgi:magnesium transporter